MLAAALIGVVVVLLAVAFSGAAWNGRRRLGRAGPAAAGAGLRTQHQWSRGAIEHPAGDDAPAVDRVFRYTSYVALGAGRRRDVALTFDDGPGPFTPRILRVLGRMHAAATFFLVGEHAANYPWLVAEEAREGFEIGDHTETHPLLSVLSPAAQASEIEHAAESIHEADGRWPHLMRPPYGSFDEATLQILAPLRMLMVLWSTDTEDYTRPGAKKISHTAVSGAQPGAIVLMHDGPPGADRSETVAALPRIISRLRQRGFRLVTISQLLTDDPPLANQPPPKPLSGRS